MNLRLVSLLAVAVLVIADPARAETTAELIAKARAYLGDETALNGVTTIHFTGLLEVMGSEPAVIGKAPTAEKLEKFPMEIIFQKPYQQQMIVNRPESIDTMVLDDYDGWSKVTVRENPKKWKITLLDAEQIKQLRANTWENLSFFAGIEKRGGMVEGGEDATIDGVACAKLSFVHSPRITFHRYFDKATGRLVKTETANGSEIREEGEISVDGIRFPKKIINKAANGQVTTIIFDKVVLNERIPASEFTVPSMASE